MVIFQNNVRAIVNTINFLGSFCWECTLLLKRMVSNSAKNRPQNLEACKFVITNNACHKRATATTKDFALSEVDKEVLLWWTLKCNTLEPRTPKPGAKLQEACV
jgi:hypothetical protein